MTNEITNSHFEMLLTTARQQFEPQQLLFVFLRAMLPKDHNPEEAHRFSAGDGGALEPVMCVAKGLDELSTFADLVEESRSMADDWRIVLVAALSGRNGISPTAEQIDGALDKIVQTVRDGDSLSNYLAFGRDGDPIYFGT